MPGIRHLIAVAVAVPLVGVTIYLGAIAAAERAGGTWSAARAPANLAEAAGSARADLVVRFLREGQDPARVYPLHPDVISSIVRHATALEAAIWSRRLPLIELLDREGALPEGADRRALACLAADIEVDDVVAYLSPDGAAACMPGEALEGVLARTRGAGDP